MIRRVCRRLGDLLTGLSWLHTLFWKENMRAFLTLSGQIVLLRTKSKLSVVQELLQARRENQHRREQKTHSIAGEGEWGGCHFVCRARPKFRGADNGVIDHFPKRSWIEEAGLAETSGPPPDRVFSTGPFNCPLMREFH